MKPQKSLRGRALDILGRQEISRAELKRKLIPHAESEEEIDQLLSEFAERNWQSDKRFAEAYVHSKSHQHGQLRLKQALHAKGVSEDISRDFLPSREQELSSAAAVLQEKFKQPADNLPDKQKQMRFLAYRGFDMDTIQAVMKVDWSEDADWDREL